MRQLFLALALGVGLVLGACPALAVEAPLVGADELRGSGGEWDGQVIVVEGELVGDYGFRRDGYMWTQLNDDPYALRALVDGAPLAGGNIGIGIRMPAALAVGLDKVGGYRQEGPLVRVTGTWRYHDPNRGGESYLDVSSLEVAKPGRELEEGPDWWALLGGVALLVGAAAVRLADVRRNR